MMFKRDEMEKTLPMKMLVDLKNHLSKRNPNSVFSSFKVGPESVLTHNCRVCNLCYHLVVQENALIDVERKMAEAQGVPVKSLTAAEEYKAYTSDHIQKHLITKDKLIQWRIMIYPLAISVHFLLFHSALLLKTKKGISGTLRSLHHPGSI